MLPWPIRDFLEYVRALQTISRDPLNVHALLEHAGLSTDIQDSARLSLAVLSSCAFGAVIRYTPAIMGLYRHASMRQLRF